MAKTRIDDPQIKALFAEVAATKLVLRVLIEAILPPDNEQAWKEIEAMVSRIEDLAKNGKIGAMTDESSKVMVEAARQIAVGFVLPIGPKPTRQ